jgi:hypothetical protein
MRFQHQPEDHSLRVCVPDQASGKNDVESNIPDQEAVTVDEVGGEHVVDSNVSDQWSGEPPGDNGGATVSGDRPEGEHMSVLRVVVVTPNFVNCRHCFSRD